MGRYRVEIKPSVQKDLRALPRPMVARALECIEKLAEEPLPRESLKLAGTERLYRVRVGDYRIVYEVDADNRLVLIHHVRHRREAYRKL
jgi:mRNA interferase RelE/StbE